MQKKKCRNSRGRDMPRPCAYKMPPSLSVSSFVYLKGKSTLMIFERHANLKYKYEIAISGAEDIT